MSCSVVMPVAMPLGQGQAKPPYRPWRHALLAGFALEAATGALAGAIAYGGGQNGGVVLFLASAVAAMVTGASLVPGWLWTTGRFAPLPLLVRLVVACAFLGAGTTVALFMGFTIILIPLSFPFAAISGGWGAVAAEGVDWRTGPGAPVRVPVSVHVWGALAGVILTAMGAALINLVESPSPKLYGWPWLAVGAFTLVSASAPHDLMAAQAMQQAGVVPPPRALLLRRVGISSIAMLSLTVTVLLLTPFLRRYVW